MDCYKDQLQSTQNMSVTNEQIKIYYYKCTKIRGGKDFSFHSYILLILDKESQPQMKTASENELMVMMMVPFRRKSGKERPHQQRRKESQLRFHTRRKAFAFFCFFFFWFNQSTILISLLFHSSYICLGNDIVFFTGETKLMQR